MLKVEAPCENLPELEYILSVILEDILWLFMVFGAKRYRSFKN